MQGVILRANIRHRIPFPFLVVFSSVGLLIQTCSLMRDHQRCAIIRSAGTIFQHKIFIILCGRLFRNMGYPRMAISKTIQRQIFEQIQFELSIPKPINTVIYMASLYTASLYMASLYTASLYMATPDQYNSCKIFGRYKVRMLTIADDKNSGI